MSAIESFYKNYLLQHAWISLVILVAVLAFFASYAPNYKVDASADTLVLEGDEDLEFFREVALRYRSEEFLVIAYQPSDDLLADATLAELASLTDGLQKVDGVSSVMSILDIPLLYSPKISLSSLSGGMKTLRDPAVSRELVDVELKESPIYRQLLSSLDGDTTAIQVNLSADPVYVELLLRRETLRAEESVSAGDAEFESELKQAEREFKAYATESAEKRKVLVSEVREILEAHRPAASNIYLGGVPMIANDMVDFVQSDLRIFGVGVLLFMIVLLATIFRALRWIVLPVLACVAVNVFMLGFLGLLDWRMTVVSSNFVALLLIISLAVAVHLIVRYRELEQLNPTASRHALASRAAGLMFKPCLFTALTTIVAFGSLVVSGIRPIIDFGWMMTVGVVAALTWTFLIVPVGMVLIPAPSNRQEDDQAEDLVNESAEPADEGAFTLKFARITERWGVMIFVVTLAMIAFTVTGINQLKVENRFIDYFDETTEIYQGMELIDAELGGTIPLDIMLFASARDTDESDVGQDMAIEDDFSDEFDDDFSDEFDGSDEFEDEFSNGGSQANEQSQWFTRSGLELVSQVHDYADSLPETGKVLSLATVYDVASDLLDGSVDDIQLALAYKSLPPSIADTLIKPYLNAEYDEARITIRVKETSRTLNRSELLAQINEFLQTELKLSPDSYRLTGMLVLYNNMLQSLFQSQIMTLGLVFGVITLTLALLFRSIVLALLAVFPNALAALLVLGGMGWVGLPLDMMTITIAAISIGIGVDNTIHYVHRFMREFSQDRNYIATMYRCHGSIGKAMYYTSITIIFGFSILALSNFKPSIYFGVLTGTAMLCALLGALLLLPRLLIMVKPLGAESSSK